MSVVRNMETEGGAFFYAANRLMRQLLDYAEMVFPNDDEAVFATPARVMMQVRSDVHVVRSYTKPERENGWHPP